MTIISGFLKDVKPIGGNRRRKIEQEKFSTYNAASSARSSSQAEIESLDSIAPFLGIFDIEFDNESNGKARDKCNSILKSLNVLRDGILNGELNTGDINSIRLILDSSEFETVDEPYGSLINDMKVRIAIELEKAAKL